MKFLDRPPRFLFFTGKGGVGKTSIACATAITLARNHVGVDFADLYTDFEFVLVLGKTNIVHFHAPHHALDAVFAPGFFDFQTAMVPQRIPRAFEQLDVAHIGNYTAKIGFVSDN